jgi:hypothetical protein
MTKLVFKLIAISSIVLSSITLSAQTTGSLTFTFTEIAKAPTYNGNSQHVMAVWIQTNAGGFVKTKLRFAGGGTSDHLPTWSVNAGGSAANCMSAAANVVDATTGATRASWTSYNVTWDGNIGPAGNGTLQPDGIYKVTLQSTWNHGTGGTAVTSFTFTKGPNQETQTPANTANYSNIFINWVPTAPTGINESTLGNPEISVYPNPTSGIFNIDYTKATNIKVTNTLGMVVYDEKVQDPTSGAKSIDLSSFANGIYFINVSNDNGSSKHKVILNK